MFFRDFPWFWGIFSTFDSNWAISDRKTQVNQRSILVFVKWWRCDAAIYKGKTGPIFLQNLNFTWKWNHELLLKRNPVQFLMYPVHNPYFMGKIFSSILRVGKWGTGALRQLIRREGHSISKIWARLCDCCLHYVFVHEFSNETRVAESSPKNFFKGIISFIRDFFKN